MSASDLLVAFVAVVVLGVGSLFLYGWKRRKEEPPKVPPLPPEDDDWK